MTTSNVINGDEFRFAVLSQVMRFLGLAESKWARSCHPASKPNNIDANL